MSTELGSIPAKIEMSAKNESIYYSTNVSVTRFYGGDARGVSVQLTFSNAKGDYQHVQIAQKDIQPLIDKLSLCVAEPPTAEDCWDGDGYNPE